MSFRSLRCNVAGLLLQRPRTPESRRVDCSRQWGNRPATDDHFRTSYSGKKSVFLSDHLQSVQGTTGLSMSSKADFIQALARSEPDFLSSKSWGGDNTDKQFIGNPTFYIFVDMDYFGLLSTLEWVPESYRSEGIKVPAGFVTDFASVPRLFWSIFPPIGRYGYAALFHDYVYWDQKLTRAQADAVFKNTMEELGVPGWKKAVLYSAVRLFGFAAWKNNSTLKANHERRILKAFPDNATISWRSWKMDPRAYG